ncbi:hypothetical protein X979_4970 [Burkholderia pseudomallei MSHR7527]|nr:hypothetical protein X979_4970 [Burkholderia pseudomallei MSHR7527]KGX75076.1 hypothetical protein Y033_4708 [Burkholderia pseudomallei MSHR435]
MNADAHRRQFIDRRPYIHRVPSKPVKFGDDQHVAFLQPVEQLGETGPLFRGNRTGHTLGDHTARVDIEPGRTNLNDLIVRGLLGC